MVDGHAVGTVHVELTREADSHDVTMHVQRVMRSYGMQCVTVQTER